MDWMGLIKIGTVKNTKNSLGKISLAQKKAKYHKNWHRKKFQKQMWKNLRGAKKSKKKAKKSVKYQVKFVKKNCTAKNTKKIRGKNCEAQKKAKK